MLEIIAVDLTILPIALIIDLQFPACLHKTLRPKTQVPQRSLLSGIQSLLILSTAFFLDLNFCTVQHQETTVWCSGCAKGELWRRTGQDTPTSRFHRTHCRTNCLLWTNSRTTRSSWSGLHPREMEISVNSSFCRQMRTVSAMKRKCYNNIQLWHYCKFHTLS